MLCQNIVLFFSLVFVFKGVECALVRRFNYDARLYEHFALDSRFIQYSRTEPYEWKNITALADTRNFTFTSMICTLGPGAWLFYPDPNYEMGNSQNYYLIIGEHCIRSDDIESIQPLGKMDELLEQGILLFEKPQFASPQTLIAEGEGSGTGGSLIFTGGASFVIEGSGLKICLRPGLTVFDNGYCLIPNLKSSFGMEGTINVKENCTEREEEDDATDTSDEKKLVVQNCYMSGVHEIYSDQDLTIDKLNEVCSGGGDDFLKAKFTILMEMWEKRLGEDEINRQPENIKPENLVKLTILWQVIEIFKDSCKSVDEIYVYLLGHLFAMHLKHIWNSDDYNATSTTPEQWKVTQDVFQFCAEEHDEEKYTYGGTCKSTDEFNRMADSTKGFTEEDASWFEIVNGEMFDPVIEQMWLIINFVLPTCSLITGYINNDWSDLVVLFHENYLDPLQDMWADPGEWRRIYNAVFHGYDMRDEHRDIVSCLRGALEASPSYDPIGRPKSFREYMTYKYQTPNHGAIENPSASKSKRELLT